MAGLRDWAVAVLPLCAACSLIELSSEIDQGSCERDEDCEILNDTTASDYNTCNIWQCGPAKLCEKSRRDYDRDGFEPFECSPEDLVDCDDRDRDKHPGGQELCDGKDNDCDRRLDEGAIDITPRRALAFASQLRDLNHAWDPDAAQLAVGYALGLGRSVPGASLVRPPTAASVLDLTSAGPELAGGAASVGLGTLAAGRFAIALLEPETPRRIWVGSLFPQAGQLTPRFDPDLLRVGLRCAADEDCAVAPAEPGGADPTGPAAPAPASTRPSLAALQLGPDRQILVGYTRALALQPETCELANSSVNTYPMLLNLLRDSDPLAPTELTDAAIQLDATSEARSPSLLAIDNSLVASDRRRPFGWLAGYASATGGLFVRRVTPELFVATDEPVRTFEARRRFSRVQLALGRVSPTYALVGVVTQLGCGASSDVFFRLLVVNWDADGRGSFGFNDEFQPIDTGGAHSPSLVYSAARDAWGVAYVRADGQYFRELEASGRALGDAPYYLGPASPRGLPAIVVPGADEDAWFEVLNYREDTETSKGAGLDSVVVRACKAP